MKIIFIHGANASKTSWNWIGSQIENHDRFEWGMMTDPEKNLESMEAWLTEPCFIVGHSMGGLYAWHGSACVPRAHFACGNPWG